MIKSFRGELATRGKETIRLSTNTVMIGYKINKLQLLTHPFSWTETGNDNYGNFLLLIRERNNELLQKKRY